MELTKLFHKRLFHNYKHNEHYFVVVEKFDIYIYDNNELKKKTLDIEIFNFSLIKDKILVHNSKKTYVLNLELEIIDTLYGWRRTYSNNNYLIRVVGDKIEFYNSNLEKLLELEGSFKNYLFWDNIVVILVNNKLYNITNFKIKRVIDFNDYNIIFFKNYIILDNTKYYNFEDDVLEEYNFNFNKRQKNNFYEEKENGVEIKDKDGNIKKTLYLSDNYFLNISENYLIVEKYMEKYFNIYDLDGNFLKKINCHNGFRVSIKPQTDEYCYIDRDEINIIDGNEKYNVKIKGAYSLGYVNGRILVNTKDGAYLIDIMPYK